MAGCFCMFLVCFCVLHWVLDARFERERVLGILFMLYEDSHDFPHELQQQPACLTCCPGEEVDGFVKELLRGFRPRASVFLGMDGPKGEFILLGDGGNRGFVYFRHKVLDWGLYRNMDRAS